jgi:GDPmannose 4,6-dehydratase
MLQADEPSDYVIATGETHSVREFLDAVAEELNMEWHPYVHIDPRYFRPTDVDCLLGDFSKARRVLGWEPRRTFANWFVQWFAMISDSRSKSVS